MHEGAAGGGRPRGADADGYGAPRALPRHKGFPRVVAGRRRRRRRAAADKGDRGRQADEAGYSRHQPERGAVIRRGRKIRAGVEKGFGFRLSCRNRLFFRDSALRKKIYAHYPPDGRDNTETISRLFTDYLFACANLYAAGKSAGATWSYVFDHVPSHNSWPEYPACGENVCHTAELAFVFHSAGNMGWEFTPEEERLSGLMVSYWTGFAKDLDSGGAWPEYEPGSRSLSFVTPVEDITTETPPSACAFWNGVGYDLGDSFRGLF